MLSRRQGFFPSKNVDVRVSFKGRPNVGMFLLLSVLEGVHELILVTRYYESKGLSCGGLVY
jgi:hypothetical protein